MKNALLLIAIVVAIGFLWVGRFQTVPMARYHAFYLINRWTGTIYIVDVSGYREVPHMLTDRDVGLTPSN